MPAYSDRLSSIIDQTGIETLFGSKPVQLPKLNDVQRETLRTGGLMALMRTGVIAVDPSLLQRDPSLEQTSRVLSEPEAVVRVAKAGIESAKTQFWAFVQSNQIVQLSAGAAPKREISIAALADSAALMDAIERLLPLSFMPRKAYARIEVGKDDAQDIFDQIADDGANTAVEFLVSDGLTDEQAQVAFDVMRTSTISGRISFLAVRKDNVVLTSGLTVGQDGGDIWMAIASQSQADGLVLETVLKGAFHSRLETGWASLGLG